MRVKVEYNIIHRAHDGYCSDKEASDDDDSFYEQLGVGIDELTVDDKYFDSTGKAILSKFHKQLSYDCCTGEMKGSGACNGYGIWKRAKAVTY